MKKLAVLLLIVNFILPSYAITLEDLTVPQKPAYRAGLSEIPEQEYTEAKAKYSPLNSQGLIRFGPLCSLNMCT